MPYISEEPRPVVRGQKGPGFLHAGLRQPAEEHLGRGKLVGFRGGPARDPQMRRRVPGESRLPVVVREERGLRLQPICEDLLAQARRGLVEHFPHADQEPAVGDLLGQRVAEPPRAPLLVLGDEEASVLEAAEPGVEVHPRGLERVHPAKERRGELRPQDRRHLQQDLDRPLQAVDPFHDETLHRSRDPGLPRLP